MVFLPHRGTHLTCSIALGLPESGYRGGMEKSILARVLPFVVLIAACGSDGGSKSGSSNEGGVGGSGSTSSDLPSCESTCPGVLAAKCASGPVSQSDCVSGCETVRASACAAQYRALYTCGGATPSYKCTSLGQVGIAGCDDQTNALWSCLSGT